ncbi:hypothetical protein FNV43_RR17115 [Rhamnella rubrinervis]|uniref:Uncharacterized protein n=1 Tax=Rhamnella rubrinervis TaxID=2594499 RepID=A0A8K0E3N4_9ROSA|nr:hypothetical protein FNV43_RR17115 [Rhamnella rubrinervis]
MNRVSESPGPPPVEKKGCGTIEQQALTKTTTTSASEQGVTPRGLAFKLPAKLQGPVRRLCLMREYKGPAKWQVVRRLIPVDKKYHAHLTSNSTITYAIDMIKNKLSKGMDKLQNSFVGKFLELKIVQFYGSFVHLLLLNQVECDDTNVIEFDFHGIGARFDRMSFAMIMGLNYGKFPHEKELEHLPYDLYEYIVKNELRPIALELQQTYMKELIPPSDRKYYGPPVFRVEASQSQPIMLPSLTETVAHEGTKTASHPPSDQLSNLKL